MNLFSQKSGFRSARDLLTYLLGVGLLLWHLTTNKPNQWNSGFLIFCASLFGVPYILGRDEKRHEEDRPLVNAVQREVRVAKKVAKK